MIWVSEGFVIDVGVEPKIAGHIAREEEDVLLHIADDGAEHVERARDALKILTTMVAKQ